MNLGTLNDDRGTMIEERWTRNWGLGFGVRLI